MSLFYTAGSATSELTPDDLRDGLFRALDSIGARRNVLAVPPDFTRHPSRAGELTRYAWDYYGSRLNAVLPALGTHSPMSDGQIAVMFGGVPRELFRVHDWRHGLATMGEVPAEFVREQSEGALNFSWPVQVNRVLAEGGFDLILSLGQVVPHEVAGMAGYNKNILIGAGGSENINKSHFLGAVYGMERIMGRTDNPVRRVLNFASDHFLGALPIVHVLTIVDQCSVVRGMAIGDDIECFKFAARLSLEVNFVMLDRPIRKAVVYLPGSEFHSTWLGNKAIYRTRMAVENDGELVILAPGVRDFGEDREIDTLIRRFGYHGTPATLSAVRNSPELGQNLSAAAHLIHGSSEGRFRVTYCPGHLSREEVEAAGFSYRPLGEAMEQYSPAKLRDGYNVVQGEEVYYISNPALGLWAHRERFLAGDKAAVPPVWRRA